MNKIFFYITILFFCVFSACKGKESCEINHTGNISITNVNDFSIDVFINSTKVATLQKEQVFTIAKPIGTYSIKINNNILVKEFSDIKVTQCETTKISADFYE